MGKLPETMPDEDIHAAIDALQTRELILRPDPEGLNGAGGGSWTFSEGSGSFVLLLPALLQMHFHTHRDFVRRLVVFEGGLRVGETRINVCVSRWIEDIGHPNPAPLLSGLARPIAMRSHMTIEQINYANHKHAAIEGLSDGDLEKVAAFIRVPVQDLLEGDVASLKKFGGTADKPFPVTGELHENWRAPRREFVELHEHLSNFREGSFIDRINAPELQKYTCHKREFKTFFTVDGEPDVKIEMPWTDRERPQFNQGTVMIGQTRVPIDIHDFSSIIFAEPLQDSVGPPVERFYVFAMVHPLSLRIKPESKVPPHLDMETATRAVEHMKNAWLRYQNDSYRQMKMYKVSRADVVII